MSECLKNSIFLTWQRYLCQSMKQEGSDTSGTVARTGQANDLGIWQWPIFPWNGKHGFWGSEATLEYLLVDVVESRLHKTTCAKWSFVISSGYQVFSVILTSIVFEMDQNGQIIRYWDMVLIGGSMITLKKSTSKEVSSVLIVVQIMHRWRLISTTSNSMRLPTLTLRLWCVYLCTRAIIRLRAPCPNNS